MQLPVPVPLEGKLPPVLPAVDRPPPVLLERMLGDRLSLPVELHVGRPSPLVLLEVGMLPRLQQEEVLRRQLGQPGQPELSTSERP